MRRVATDKIEAENGILTISDLAEMLQVSIATIYSLNYRRISPPYIRVGKSVRYRRQAVEKWLLDQESSTWHQ